MGTGVPLKGGIEPEKGFNGPNCGSSGLFEFLLGCSGDLASRPRIGVMGLIMACYLGLRGIPIGLTKSADHPSSMDPYLLEGDLKKDGPLFPKWFMMVS